MAATAPAYRNSGESQSAKKRDFLSRQDISELLDGADFSREIEAAIIRREGRQQGRRNYRRRHLVAALKGIWRASSSPYGNNELLCYASVEGYAIEAGVSERALRYNLRELERLGIVQLVFAANTVRRPATYRLNLAALRRRRTYDEVKKARPPRHALHSFSHSSPAPPQEPASMRLDAVAAAPVAVVAPPRTSSPKLGTRQFERIRKDRAELKALIADLVEGCHGQIYTARGEPLWVDEESALYRAPMAAEKAFGEACAALQLSEREGRELLNFEESE